MIKKNRILTGFFVGVALTATAAANAQTSQTGDPFQGSLAATIATYLNRTGQGSLTPQVLSFLPQATVYAAYNRSESKHWIIWLMKAGKKRGWFPMNAFYGYPQDPLPESENCWDGHYCRDNGGFVGGRVGDKECDELTFALDIAGNVLVPSIPLLTGGPISRAKGTKTYYSLSFPGPNWHTADSALAIALWTAHNINQGKPKHLWYGGYKLRGASSDVPDVSTSRQAYRDPLSGNIIPAHFDRIATDRNQFHWLGSVSKDCPPNGTGSNDVHYYTDSSNNASYPGGANGPNQDICTMYKPNLALSRSGYGYPEIVPIPWDNEEFVRHLDSNYMVNKCPISPEILRRSADAILKEIYDAELVPGLSYSVIPIGDVRTDGKHPTGFDLRLDPPETGSSIPVSAPDAPTPGAPPPDYFPPQGTPNDGGYLGGDSGSPQAPPVDLSHPDVPDSDWSAPEFGMPDWLPSLPSLDVPVSSECPVFGFDAFNQSYRMDSHCVFIEQNRETLAMIMVVVFSFASFVVILRA
tara:strand:- start:1564 stop:3135 length:1572 start_codon:yes stop_codon:yes gene_type:complete